MTITHDLAVPAPGAVAAGIARRAPGLHAGQASAGDYIALLKPRVMALVVFTGLAGLVAAPGTIHPLLSAVAVMCIALAGGAAGAINMWYERDIDARMERTAGRPLPQGRMHPDEALALGVFLTGAAVAMMGLALNWLAAALLLGATLFYVFVYTIWLKRRTPQNIVIGGAAGAFPPVIGWAAATGTAPLEAWSLFALIFLWTPPHFWALSLLTRADYGRAGIPMLPVVAGERETRRQIVLYSWLLLPASVLPWWFGMAGPVYLGGALIGGAMFVAGAHGLWRDPGPRRARRLFAFSIAYLFALFALLLGEGVARDGTLVALVGGPGLG